MSATRAAHDQVSLPRSPRHIPAMLPDKAHRLITVHNWNPISQSVTASGTMRQNQLAVIPGINGRSACSFAAPDLPRVVIMPDRGNQPREPAGLGAVALSRLF
jgi:hypothetical protein